MWFRTSSYVGHVLTIFVAVSLSSPITAGIDFEHQLANLNHPLGPLDTRVPGDILKRPLLDRYNRRYSRKATIVTHLANDRSSFTGYSSKKAFTSKTGPGLLPLQSGTENSKITSEIMLRTRRQVPFHICQSFTSKELLENEETGNILAIACHRMYELQRQLSATEQQLAVVRELNLLTADGNSALRLGNGLMAQMYREEKLKSLQLKTNLLEPVKCNVEVNQSQTHLINSTEPLDLKESIYNGERWIKNWDGRMPKGNERNVTATRILYFIRHGHYENSLRDEGIPLSELGRQQAAAVGDALSVLKQNWTKKMIVSSKLRTLQTAEIITSRMPGVFEMSPTPLIWSSSKDSEIVRRQEAFRQILHRAPPEQTNTSYELIVTHSSMIRYFIERALQVPKGTITSIPLDHGSVTRLEIPPDGKIRLLGYGEYNHLPKHLQSSTNVKWLPGGALPALTLV